MALLRKRKKKSDEETTPLPPNADAAEDGAASATNEGADNGPEAESDTATLVGNADAEQALADLPGLDALEDESGGDSESGATPDDEDDEDDLMSIFETEEVEDSDLSALTGNLEEVDMDSVLDQSREVLDLLRGRAGAP